MSKSLFIGQGVSGQCWYRCALPSIHLENSDWAGMSYTENPTEEHFGVMIGGSSNEYPKASDYDVIILQMVRGDDWVNLIKKWQSEGIKVLYEVDDFFHGVGRIQDHAFKSYFHKKNIKRFVAAMKACDGVICSTEFLANQYKKYNENIHVCLVSLDTKRYNIEFAPKNNLTIGWAGGTGHHKAVGPWLEVISAVMRRNPTVGFTSLGVDYASAIEPYHPNRTLSIPWVPIENYPYALTNMDLAICPAHDSKYFKSKSDLRFLEASALGIPTISSPITYGDHKDRTILASNTEEFETELEDFIYEANYDKLEKAKKYVLEERDIEKGVSQWIKAIEFVK